MMTKDNPVSHRDFLGAHRYTTGGGIVRPTEVTIVKESVVVELLRGNYISPTVCGAHLPLCVLCAGLFPKKQEPPGTKFIVCYRNDRKKGGNSWQQRISAPGCRSADGVKTVTAGIQRWNSLHTSDERKCTVSMTVK